MSKEYTPKDLGYKRTPTNAKYVVTMPNGDVYSVPVQIIVDYRDEWYKKDEEDTVGFIRAGSLDTYEVYDYASNNMDWDDVKEYAELVKKPPQKEPDFQDGWVNGEHDIVGTI